MQDAAAALADPNFSTLVTLLGAAADVQLPPLDGKKEVIVAPVRSTLDLSFCLTRVVSPAPCFFSSHNLNSSVSGVHSH